MLIRGSRIRAPYKTFRAIGVAKYVKYLNPQRIRNDVVDVDVGDLAAKLLLSF
ncbi:hypothetical protein D3C86_1765730 [compost metagenome]